MEESYKEYEEKVEKNQKRNEKFISEFKEWLNQKGLVRKTISKHLRHVHLYINDYLVYYEVIKAEEGIAHIDSFLGGWFIEKCMWVNKNSIKEMSASLKKFYQYMSEKGYVNKEDYDSMCMITKDDMEYYLEQLEAFDNGIYYDLF